MEIMDKSKQKSIEQLIPSEVLNAWQILIKAGFKVYLVGGCVRDYLLKRKIKDWDLATNATPEDILKIFGDKAYYTNQFGTVGLKSDEFIIEITTFRREGRYKDFRHPEKVDFVDSLEEDLRRRDFTINALALSFDGQIIDMFNGLNDLRNKIIRCVGDPRDRFREDALRMMRAIRFACQLSFNIEDETFEAIKENANLIRYISWERIRDEFTKIIMTKEAMKGIELLKEAGLLIEILPELLQGDGVTQNKHHKYTVYEHNIRSLDYAAKKNYSLEVRLASLLHDIGKPLTKQGEGPDCTFYNHEIVGAKMARKILERFRYPKEIVDKVSHLIRHHMFYFDLEIVTEAAIRRFVNRIGVGNLESLFQLREADRIGSGVPKAEPYRLRKLKFLIAKVLSEPSISLKNLKINGHDILSLGEREGPRVGWILKSLLEEVIDDPTKNNREILINRAKELMQLSDDELKERASRGEEKQKEIERRLEEDLKKHFNI